MFAENNAKKQKTGSAKPADPRRRDKKRRRTMAAIGAIAIAFAIFGAATAVKLGFDGISKLTDKTASYLEYEKFLTPIVMNDPTPFDDISRANMQQLLDSAIWALLRSDLDPDQYEYSEGENFGIIVPQSDIEVQFTKLFGSELKPVHGTITGGSYEFAYDEARQAYIIPITSVMPTYIPKVYDSEKKGSSIILTVGYLGGSEWEQDEQGNYITPEPDKYMKITLRESNTGYYLSAIQATDAPEAAPTRKPAATEPPEPVTTTEPSTEAPTTTAPETSDPEGTMEE